MKDTTTYGGNYADHQITGNTYNGVKYGLREHTNLNNYQTLLYNRALFGLNAYSPGEKSTMHWEKKKRIKKVHNKAQDVLNRHKQKISNVLATNILGRLFPNSPVVRDLIPTAYDTDSGHVNEMPLKDLGITKPEIIRVFIEAKVLPINFYELANAS